MPGEFDVRAGRPPTGPSGLRRGLRIGAGAVTAIGAAGLATVAWFGSERALNPLPIHYDWSLDDYRHLDWEPMVVTGAGDVTLHGRFFPGAGGATVVLNHGYGDSQDQMLPWAAFLQAAGFNAVTYDMRARGISDGRYVTLGALEQEDLLAVIDAVANRPSVDPDRIGVLGVSLGGSVAILAAARDQRIKAVVDDAGFSDAPAVIATSFKRFVGLPAFPFATLSVRLSERRAGVRMSNVRPVDVISAISPRPVLIIHGTEDRAVPTDNSERLYAAVRDPKPIWWVPGARHVESRVVAREAYEERVTAFFREHLAA